MGPSGKAKLLQRTVLSNFLWKVSRWPFQKSVAVAMDKVQCSMMAIIVPCPRANNEGIDHFCRRRLRQARNICQQVGFWSTLWCKRVIDWNEHIKRGARYSHMCSRLLNYHASSWLQEQRQSFVPSNPLSQSASRHTLFSGRTGTRMNIGRPQVRWHDGCELATMTLNARPTSRRGNNARTIGSIIKEVLDTARQIVNRSSHQDSLL